MEKKHLIGKKVKITGFWWGSEGKTGEVYNVREIGSVDLVDIKFYDGGTIEGVPINLIKQTQPSQYEVGMTVWDIEFGQGIITRINSSTMYPIEVKFEGSREDYSKDGKWLKSSINCWYPRLSLTPYDLVNGGATFPTFKPELPEIEKGMLVYVRLSKKSEWLMRFFSHFNEDGLAVCFECQNKSGNGAPWPEYSLTNPLIEKQ